LWYWVLSGEIQADPDATLSRQTGGRV